jgi:hypothetical protein
MTSGGFDKTKHSHIIIDAIIIKKDIDSEIIRENAAYILGLLKEKYDHSKKTGMDMSGNQLHSLHLVVSVKESSYMKGYETLNTVTIEMSCFYDGNHYDGNHDDEPVIVALFSEDTEETTSSYRYLYRILDRVFRKIFY